MLNPEILRKMKFYVYILSDPSDNEIFYVGKGKNNRAFSHLTNPNDNPITRKIKEIRNKGLEPKIEFLVHGVEDDHTVKKIDYDYQDWKGKNIGCHKYVYDVVYGVDVLIEAESGPVD